MKDFEVEICCGDLSSIIAAKEGGASRIELCSGLSEGGLTPSAGMVKAAVASGIPNINVLIRPRSGDFLYSSEEVDVMEYDIRNAVGAGATGIVIGALTPEGNVDVDVCRRLIEAARNIPGKKINVTFHRAFDLSRDADKSMADIVDLGCDCLLTSGMANSAIRGIPLLKELAERWGDRITIMAGSGVNPANVVEIVSATGVKAIHSTARKPVASRMIFRRPSVPMGAPGLDEYAPLHTSADVVAELIGKVRNAF